LVAFSTLLLWTINGVGFYVLLFATDQWFRLVPLTWNVFPNALSTAIQFASLNFSVDHSWTRYNCLQQLSYFITVFIAAPVSIATGLMQSPAISNRLGLLGTVLNRQAARSIHFISFSWFVLFILVHGIMVFVTCLRQNTNHMFAGVENNTWTGLLLCVLAMAVVELAWWVASPFTTRHARLVQRTGRLMVGWKKGCPSGGDEYPANGEGYLSAFLAERHNAELRRVRGLVAEQFDHYRLRVGGRGRRPGNFPSPTSRPCRGKNKSRLIFVSKDGPASQSGAVFRCAISWIS
jgi:methionine sulfoxide reductase catalytic subunit